MLRNLIPRVPKSLIQCSRALTTGTTPSQVLYDHTNLPVSFEDISRAYHRIESGIRRTHLDRSPFLSEICETEVFLKKEFTQFTGSFKERFVNILQVVCLFVKNEYFNTNV